MMVGVSDVRQVCHLEGCVGSSPVLACPLHSCVRRCCVVFVECYIGVVSYWGTGRVQEGFFKTIFIILPIAADNCLAK